MNVCPNNPIQRGRRPSIDAKVIQARDSLKEDFQAGVQAGLKHTSFETLVMPRGGYTHFDADNTLADAKDGDPPEHAAIRARIEKKITSAFPVAVIRNIFKGSAFYNK